jgi:raffinose/stachyose/melibiose transport system substrate-binding protein
VGVPFSIRKTTAQPDLAAEYLDWMISPRAAELWAGVGMLPAMPMADDAVVEVDPLFTDTMIAWNTVNEENAVGHYIDWATPTFYDTIVAELQKLFGMVTTPAEFTAAVQVDYATFLSGN